MSELEQRVSDALAVVPAGRQGRHIPLRSRTGRIVAKALVDDADYEWVSQYRWSLDSTGNYARRGTMRSGEPQRTYFMHRELLGLKHNDRREVDHINRDKLDNRRANLRIVTRAQNSQNLTPRGRSRHRGVWLDRRRGRWVAEAKLNYKKTYIGSFEHEEEAAEAAREWRRANMPYTQETE